MYGDSIRKNEKAAMVRVLEVVDDQMTAVRRRDDTRLATVRYEQCSLIDPIDRSRGEIAIEDRDVGPVGHVEPGFVGAESHAAAAA